MDEKEEILYDREVAHKYSDFHEAIEEFKEIEAREEVAIGFAIEGKNGYGTPFEKPVICPQFLEQDKYEYAIPKIWNNIFTNPYLCRPQKALCYLGCYEV